MKIKVSQLVFFVLILALVAVGVYFGTQQLTGKNSKVRQAVFLTNGQVYFGYVQRANSKTVTLSDIYYLQVQQPIQPAEDKDNQQPQISLVKLGEELHGPEDEMRINRDHILFIEDMKDESRVNQAIADYIKNGRQPTAPSPTPAP